ncbi:hypothetical protein ABT025_32360 [Streptomyces sp. NPDC002809]
MTRRSPSSRKSSPVTPSTPTTRHREAIDRWSSEPGRTAADAARAEHALF